MAAKVTKALARSIAQSFKGTPSDPDLYRAVLDTKTGGELDVTQLDLLSDWVMEEIAKAKA